MKRKRKARNKKTIKQKTKPYNSLKTETLTKQNKKLEAEKKPKQSDKLENDSQPNCSIDAENTVKSNQSEEMEYSDESGKLKGIFEDAEEFRFKEAIPEVNMKYDDNMYNMLMRQHLQYRQLLINIKVGWLVYLGLTALSDSSSVYIGPSPREREKEKRNDRREKISKQPPSAPTASTQVQQALALLPSKLVGRPGTQYQRVQDERVAFNIGGQCFSTSRATLGADPSSLFGLLLRKNCPKRPHRNTYFIGTLVISKSF